MTPVFAPGSSAAIVTAVDPLSASRNDTRAVPGHRHLPVGDQRTGHLVDHYPFGNGKRHASSEALDDVELGGRGDLRRFFGETDELRDRPSDAQRLCRALIVHTPAPGERQRLVRAAVGGPSADAADHCLLREKAVLNRDVDAVARNVQRGFHDRRRRGRDDDRLGCPAGITGSTIWSLSCDRPRFESRTCGFPGSMSDTGRPSMRASRTSNPAGDRHADPPVLEHVDVGNRGAADRVAGEGEVVAESCQRGIDGRWRGSWRAGIRQAAQRTVIADRDDDPPFGRSRCLCRRASGSRRIRQRTR